MTQMEIEESVAAATGESLSLIQNLGFGIADPLDIDYDPEPRHPLVLDWDEMVPVLWNES